MKISIDKKEFIWVEKYRPKTIDSIILSKEIKNMFKKWISDEEIPNMLLVSKTPGLGKSSAAHVLINEMDAEAMFINTSLFPNIDTLRNKIHGFVTTSSFNDKPKLVIMDEFDGANQNSLQPAFRGFVEEFSKNARFILTANVENKIIEPIRNRMITINFDEMMANNKTELIKETALNSIEILKNEKIKYDNTDVAYLVKHYYPSNRKIINKLQELSHSGTLKINRDEVDTDTLNLDILKNIHQKNFDELRRNCARLPDPSSLFLTLYENITDFDQTLRPNIIILIAKYQSFDSQVRDRLINIVALCVEIQELL